MVSDTVACGGVYFRRACGFQALLVVVFASAVALWSGQTESGSGAGVATLYGGATAVASSLLLRWRFGRDLVTADPGRHLRTFFRSWFERLIAVILLLSVGLVVLKLQGGMLVAGFVFGQAAWLMAGWLFRN